jgi:hypothetical protein
MIVAKDARDIRDLAITPEIDLATRKTERTLSRRETTSKKIRLLQETGLDRIREESAGLHPALLREAGTNLLS